MNGAIAVDAVCVRGLNSFECSEIYVKFLNNMTAIDASDLERAGMFKDRFKDNNQKLATYSLQEIAQQHFYFERQIQWVNIWCNDELCGAVNAFIGPDNRLCFFDPSTRAYNTQPSSNALKELHLNYGKNVVAIKHEPSNATIDFELWLYNFSDKLIVMDIDGTITKSDVRGYFETVYRGTYTYVHEGLYQFTQYVEQSQNLHVIYLTARPSVHITETRLLVNSLKFTTTHVTVNPSKIPIRTGPIFTNRAQLLKAAYGELIARTTVTFKSDAVTSVVDAFQRAGSACNPFVLGIGNRPTDAKAYRIAGIPSHHILMINTWSSLVVYSETQLAATASSATSQLSTTPPDGNPTTIAAIATSQSSSAARGPGPSVPHINAFAKYVSDFLGSRVTGTSTPTQGADSAVRSRTLPHRPETKPNTKPSFPRPISMSARGLGVVRHPEMVSNRSQTPPPTQSSSLPSSNSIPVQSKSIIRAVSDPIYEETPVGPSPDDSASLLKTDAAGATGVAHDADVIDALLQPDSDVDSVVEVDDDCMCRPAILNAVSIESSRSNLGEDMDFTVKQEIDAIFGDEGSEVAENDTGDGSISRDPQINCDGTKSVADNNNRFANSKFQNYSDPLLLEYIESLRVRGCCAGVLFCKDRNVCECVYCVALAAAKQVQVSAGSPPVGDGIESVADTVARIDSAATVHCIEAYFDNCGDGTSAADVRIIE